MKYKVTCLEDCPEHVLDDMLYKHWMRDIANAEDAFSSADDTKVDHASSGFDKSKDRFQFSDSNGGHNSVLWRSLTFEDIASYLESAYPCVIDAGTVSALVKDDVTNENCEEKIRQRMHAMYYKDVSRGLPVDYQIVWMGEKIRIPVERLTTMNIAQYVLSRYDLRISPRIVLRIVKAKAYKSKDSITTHGDCPKHVLNHLLALHNKSTDMERSYAIQKSDSGPKTVHLSDLTPAHMSQILSYRHGHPITDKAVERIIRYAGPSNPPETPEYGVSREGSPSDNPLLHVCDRAHTYELKDTACDCEGGREGMEKRETEFRKSGLASARRHYCSKASAPKWKSTRCNCDGGMDERQEKYNRFQRKRTERSTDEELAKHRRASASSKQLPRSMSQPRPQSPPMTVTVSAGGRRSAGHNSSGRAPVPAPPSTTSDSGSPPVRIGRRTRRSSEVAPSPMTSDSDRDSDNIHVRHWAKRAPTRSSSGSSPRVLTWRDREARESTRGAES